MVDAFTVAAVVLLLLGVVGSVTPLVPGALLSLAGVYLYWWSTGYVSPGPLLLAAFTVVGLAALVFDYFAGAISARAGGASLSTTIAAAVVGVVLFFVAGPVGVLVGVAGTVFGVEFYRNRDVTQGAKTALYATVGMLASVVVQFLLTASMLVAFVLLVAL